MFKNNWYVITGSPSSGKTTIINRLNFLGYKTVGEVGRAYIKEKLDEGLTIHQIRKDKKAFQDEIMKRKIILEKSLNREEVIFLDRGIPDTYAYYELHKIPFDSDFKKALRSCAYKKIFFLKKLSYEKDEVRTESEEDCNILHFLLKKNYQRLNFQIIVVPVLPVKERVDFILNNL